MNAIEYKKYGPWALVTGASSGIGKEFARQLAANGLNVVLVARRKQVLDNVARELESKYNIKTKVIAVDLSQPKAIDIIAKATKDIEIGLLVNNAATLAAGALVKTEMTDQMQTIQVNIVASLQLAHLFGRKMSQRGRGGLIFVASIGGYFSLPYWANYMATKAYLISLGEALHCELKKKGVDVTVLCPEGTKTGGQFRAKGLDGRKLSDKGSMSVTPVVASALKALGQKPTVIPGLMNNIIVFIFTRLLPRKVVRNIFAKMMKKGVLKEFL